MNFLKILLAAFLLLGLTSCEENNPSEPMETPLPRISISSVSGQEANGENVEMIFEVRLSYNTATEIKVDYTTQDVTATQGEDYLPAVGTLSIPAGNTTGTISVTILPDTEEESDEDFLLTLSSATGATISIGDAKGTIRDYKEIIDDAGDGYITPLEYDDYNLIWNDEFTGDIIDPATYTHEQGDHGWGNQELQNYTPSSQNSFLEDGKLIIRAIEESPGNYTSARIVTKDKFNFRYGRVDIRAKVPTAQGIWPALWMLGANFGEVSWPACGEVDIMELVGFEPNTIHGTAHWGNQGQGYSIHKGASKSLPGSEVYSDKFNVFSIEWQEDRIDWFMNDQRFFTLTKASVGSEVWRFNNEFFFIMNVAVGGTWPGYPDATTTFPQEMVIDYIRVFQK